MKYNIIKLLCVVTVFAFFSSCTGRKQIDTNIIKDGDIIFQNKKSKSSELLNVLTEPEFNHMGVLISRNGKWYVLEAAQPVELTPVAGWINSGEKDEYVIKRLKDADTLMTQENIENFRKISGEYLGKPYDSRLEWSNDAFYACELVWKLFVKVFGIELCVPQILGDFDLTAADIREKVKEVYGNKVPLYEEIISPTAVFNSDRLITIMDNAN